MSDDDFSNDSHESGLSRRERQILDIIYHQGASSVAEVREMLPDPPSYSAVRAMLRIMEEKGHLSHSKQGIRYVFDAVRPHDSAAKSALRRVVDTFFAGSLPNAFAGLLSTSETRISERELAALSEMIEKHRSIEP
jgi:predicted transcriptional regulator